MLIVVRFRQLLNIGLRREPAVVHAVAFQLIVVNAVQPMKASSQMPSTPSADCHTHKTSAITEGTTTDFRHAVWYFNARQTATPIKCRPVDARHTGADCNVRKTATSSEGIITNYTVFEL